MQTKRNIKHPVFVVLLPYLTEAVISLCVDFGIVNYCACCDRIFLTMLGCITCPQTIWTNYTFQDKIHIELDTNKISCLDQNDQELIDYLETVTFKDFPGCVASFSQDDFALREKFNFPLILSIQKQTYKCEVQMYFSGFGEFYLRWFLIE